MLGGISFTSYTTSYHDDNGHGTHVAGIIGAENNEIGIVGSAPDADVFAVKVLDKNGSGYLSDIIKGIDWAISNKMDIVNLSLGTSSDSLALRQIVDKAYNSGMLVVAAAGNNGDEKGTLDSVGFPARYPSTIAVAAIDSTNQRGSFSATGNTVEISAPGVNVLSTYLNNQYMKMSGTSMATPYVAGTLALFKQMYPTLSHIQLRAKLAETALDIGTTGKDSFYGYGVVQAPVFIQEQAPSLPKEIVKEQIPASVVNQVKKQPVPTPAKQPVKLPVKAVPNKVVKKPIVKKNLISTLSSTRSTYHVGSTIWVKLKALDKISRKPIANGTVKLTVKPPKGKAKVVTLKTNKKGEVSYKLVTNKRTTKGSYKFSATTSVANYNQISNTKTVRLK